MLRRLTPAADPALRQISLEGFEDSLLWRPETLPDGKRADSYSLFLALMPSAGDQLRLFANSEQIQRYFKISMKYAQQAERLHTTLLDLNQGVAFPNPPSRVLVEAVVEALKGAHLPPAPVRFDRIRSFNGQALTLRCDRAGREAALDLRRVVSSRLKSRRLPALSTGELHMTLHYSPPAVIGEVLIEPIDWNPDHLALILSHVGAHHHEHIARWPLQHAR
ncbi:hypothetical protein [Pelomonas sp. KK5]|uniref:hypothetical protein n=1 Tax=Pelomonas sp. KK5 TaxID=1855730 RepID=UPI00117D10A0|nr:hypothetical protein [Pelomonas sp. KK5]